MTNLSIKNDYIYLENNLLGRNGNDVGYDDLLDDSDVEMVTECRDDEPHDWHLH